MLPTLEDGDYVITRKPRHYQPGLIYVIDHIDLGLIVKRLVREDKSQFIFTGDNPSSTPKALLSGVSCERIKSQAVLAITASGLKRL